ncbi:MAG: fluoride efflux transporter CrcB [Prolixibacteraceae bacterium]|jgi:CrcB protein|nr:fluoride efflux transporter CrcB [Prolixibacteraceae bacterium]
MWRTILIVGTGGFLGSVSRYLGQVGVEKVMHSSFPWGTFAVNILGSFIIGMVYAFAEKGNLLSAEWRLFLAVGFCGGFTTFSSFAYNNLTLLKDQAIGMFLLNTLGSVTLGIFMVYAGIVVVRLIF